MILFIYDIMNGLSRRVYGVWDKSQGWVTYSGRIIVSRDSSRLEELASCDNRSIRRFHGFLDVDYTEDFPGYENDPYWRIEND